MVLDWKTHSCLGYTLIILFVGFPVWWATTTGKEKLKKINLFFFIYLHFSGGFSVSSPVTSSFFGNVIFNYNLHFTVDRANLPYEEIQNLKDPILALSILLISDDASEVHDLGPKLQQLFQNARLLNINFRSRVRSELEQDAFATIKNLQNLDQRISELHPATSNSLILFETSSLLFSNEENILAIGQDKTLFFRAGAESSQLVKAIQEIIGIDLIDNIGTAIISPSQDKNPQWTLRRPTASSSFDILFSLMIPEPERFKPRWKIEESIQKYFHPILNSISEVYDVSVKSQILYLTSLNLKPTNKNGYFATTQNELGLALNTGSQFSSHVSSRQTLNFLTYIPTSRSSPLQIVDNLGKIVSTNAFLVPRWGGVLILNTNQTDLDMKPVMSVYVTHFRSLIGLNHYNTRTTFKIGNEIIAPIEKAFLIRLGCVENLAVSKMTMQSLSHLLTKISNIVINEEVSEQVYSAVLDYSKAIANADLGMLDEAFQQSKKSVISSEKAFFDHRLLALLYFPEDQKYAIYIPLFLPIFISYFGSIRSVFQDVFARK